jgi:pimeloyl-ACP methyl ester carboxylesterase
MFDLPEPDPDRPTGSVRLADGRLLAHTEWGAPRGYPVFYFHGTPGSRMEGAFAGRAAARQQGFRLLAVDRPGFGGSTFQPGRRFRDWPADVCALADALGIGDFGVAGHSGGGPHLFACGAGVPRGRLRFIGALGPWGPASTPETVAGMHRLDRWFTMVARRAPWLMRVSFAPLGWGARYTPRLFLDLLRRASAGPDRAALQDHRLAAHLILSEMEAFRQGGRGAAHEALIAYLDWGFDLADVGVPSYLRLGEDDIYVSAAMGRRLQNAVPGADVR